MTFTTIRNEPSCTPGSIFKTRFKLVQGSIVNAARSTPWPLAMTYRPGLWLIMLLLAETISGADGEKIFLDPAQAGADYTIQGEYQGPLSIGKAKIGIQVCAKGNGAFHAVFEPGGLPGDGWYGTDRIEADGTMANGTMTFSNQGFKAQLVNGTLVGSVSGGGSFTAVHVNRKSPTLGAKPPAGALILFDGSNANAWDGPGMDDRKWLKCGSTSKKAFTNFSLHVEFYEPFRPFDSGQERGNSGVYLQNHYEIQVLDSFAQKGDQYDCGGIWDTARPKIHMCYPPLSWQTYDIEFTAATYDKSGTKTHNAVVTITHNGILIHDHQEIPHPTGGQDGNESAKPGPIYLQEHGSPVFFRNIWVVEQK